MRGPEEVYNSDNKRGEEALGKGNGSAAMPKTEEGKTKSPEISDAAGAEHEVLATKPEVVSFQSKVFEEPSATRSSAQGRWQRCF